MMLNLFHNEQFVFDNNFDFDDRLGKQEYFAGEGVLNLVRQGNDTWETNFVPDLERIELPDFSDRGAGGGCLIFLLADSSMHAHVSEMPVGTYKKAHRHIAGYHVMCVGGSGFSLMWHEGDKDFIRIEWKHGVVFPPADQQFHQHFTTSATAGTLSRHRLRQPALPVHASAAARNPRREGRLFDQHQGRRRSDRVRGSGSANSRRFGLPSSPKHGIDVQDGSLLSGRIV